MASKGTIDLKEIAHFSKDSSQWWDENGPFRPLHRLNPTRISYLKQQICKNFEIHNETLYPFKGLKILDIGCGGGLVCEPLARMGGQITGVDADANAINIANTHAENMGLSINYKCAEISELSDNYDVVLALEIIEHVANPLEFITKCAQRIKPGGILILSTLNRTTKSYALGIVAAEYILNWVPKGTHHWKNFLKPSEIAAFARKIGLTALDITGLVYNPTRKDFILNKDDLDVNYFIVLRLQP